MRAYSTSSMQNIPQGKTVSRYYPHFNAPPPPPAGLLAGGGGLPVAVRPSQSHNASEPPVGTACTRQARAGHWSCCPGRSSSGCAAVRSRASCVGRWRWWRWWRRRGRQPPPSAVTNRFDYMPICRPAAIWVALVAILARCQQALRMQLLSPRIYTLLTLL